MSSVLPEVIAEISSDHLCMSDFCNLAIVNKKCYEALHHRRKAYLIVAKLCRERLHRRLVEVRVLIATKDVLKYRQIHATISSQMVYTSEILVSDIDPLTFTMFISSIMPFEASKHSVLRLPALRFAAALRTNSEYRLHYRCPDEMGTWSYRVIDCRQMFWTLLGISPRSYLLSVFGMEDDEPHGHKQWANRHKWSWMNLCP